MFGRIKKLEEEIANLKSELKDSDEAVRQKSVTIADLKNELANIKADYKAARNKEKYLEEELNILRNERKEIEEKTSDAVDKDSVIIQLILEKDRLAIENLKYHRSSIESLNMASEAARLALYQFTPYTQISQISHF